MSDGSLGDFDPDRNGDRDDLRYSFWIDRGGTFTDIVARCPDGKIILHKLLSENPERYVDAALQGIRDILLIPTNAPIPASRIAEVRMGTTVATNALLERQGDRTVLLITKGFKDALRIGNQNRPDIFARQIILPEMLYEQVIEVNERYTAQGEELIPVGTEFVAALQAAFDRGIGACAIALMHGYRYPTHEQQVASIARQIGFTQISQSHIVSPLMKLVSRGDTTVVDAYLSPILRRYVRLINLELSGDLLKPNPRLLFMQSNGGLTDADSFQGKDSILSGPAGGLVGAVQTSLIAGFDKIISFDMGGTSTDVAHYRGEYERSFETEIAGVRMRSPIMAIHTVAAGGSSLLHFDGIRYRVGPDSAGANPGAACYRRGGELTITDGNVMVGKLHPEFFPKIFGQDGNLALDLEIVQEKFGELAREIARVTGDRIEPEQVAQGFISIAVEKMATAIKQVSLARGYDVAEYTLCCFGGAGGQHACAIADTLGIKQIFIHAYAGVLSAYGMGLADRSTMQSKSIEARLSSQLMPELANVMTELVDAGYAEFDRDRDVMQDRAAVRIKYEGTDAAISIELTNPETTDIAELRDRFEQVHRSRYGFIFSDKALIVESIEVEAICKTELPPEESIERTRSTPPIPIKYVQIYCADRSGVSAWQQTPVFQRDRLQAGDRIFSPAIVIDATGTNVIELGWEAELTAQNNLVLQRSEIKSHELAAKKPELRSNPVLLEIFNNLFRSIAEQMGVTLQNTSYSVNIKERLDFSCAIFDQNGELVANAPHIPVHLGSMGESVQALIAACGETMQSGDVYASNNPYNGGTHLPDITVIAPIFSIESHSKSPAPIFYLASRGHHADIGGITPGSMPPNSVTVEQEGILIDRFKLVDRGRFCELELTELLRSGQYPARNPIQNIADLQAQIAANACGIRELNRAVEKYGLETVQAYMQFSQDNAEASVRQVIEELGVGGQASKDQNILRYPPFIYTLDHGSQICVSIELNLIDRTAKIDFTGTSPQQPNNFNAPKAICKAVVLYVFRTLVDRDIPLNAGCLKPIEIVIPEGSLLNPNYPSAVVAGNVETSQSIANALYGALGIMAASQGTMNNFTFGNAQYQYYETICGGSGAGSSFNGTDAVQTHMTNSRLTDPEVLEWRFPVLLEEFSIRADSGGQGQYQGGNGVLRRLRFREQMTAAILSDRRHLPPFGLEGGEPGLVGHNWIERRNGSIEELDSTATVEMQVGDLFSIETPGGGGYGRKG